jgi:hypothetical protein
LADTKRPVISQQRASRRGGRVTVTWHLTEAARVKAIVHRIAGGRLVGSRCLRSTRARRSRPLCTRYLRRGSRTMSAGIATSELTLPRRLTRGARHLRIRLRAVDAAGNASFTRAARI